MATTAELTAGMMVGEYRVERELGSGSTGRVYSAIHPLISKRAAIKVLHPELTATREPLERFIQEARAANQLGHPHIVDIVAFGKLIDGRNYVVMECLNGESLRGRAQHTRMSIADALAILGTITLALEAAHEKEISHRDLKPENVFLVEVSGNRPHVKLLDFGTANLGATDWSTRPPSPYLSPEQARNESVDHRTDIYALGAMAFELVTGHRVFEAKTAADMIAKHAKDKPRSASALNKEVPAQLDALIASMLAKDPGERPSLERIRSELRACRLLVGGALTPPAGIPVVPAPDVSDAPPARAKSKTAQPATAASTTETATAVTTPAVNRPTAPSSGTARAFAIGIIVLLVSAGIGLGVWIAMNQNTNPAAAPTEATEPTPPPPAADFGSAIAPTPAPVAAPPTPAPIVVPPVAAPPPQPAPAPTEPTPAADAAAAAAAAKAKAEAEAKEQRAKERRRARRRAKEAASAAGSAATPPADPAPQ